MSCAMEARLQVARRTCTEVHSPDAILAMTVEAVDSVISSSRGVKRPEVCGNPCTSRVERLGMRLGGMIHSGGIFDARSACFA